LDQFHPPFFAAEGLFFFENGASLILTLSFFFFFSAHLFPGAAFSPRFVGLMWAGWLTNSSEDGSVSGFLSEEKKFLRDLPVKAAILFFSLGRDQLRFFFFWAG